MKTILPIMTSLCVLAAASAMAVQPAQFPLMKDVRPPAGPAGEVAAVIVDADIFDTLDDRMANLRLFDNANREQPFLIRPLISVRTTTFHRDFAAPAPVASFRELPGNRIEVTVNRDPDRHRPVPSALRLESGLRNFEKQVTVSASRDGRTWTVLATHEAIYDYSRFVDIRKDTIWFPPADFTQFRLDISNITEKKDSPLVEIIRQTRGSQVESESEATSFRKEPFRIERIVFVESGTETTRSGTPETNEFAIAGWTVTNDVENRQTAIEFQTRRQPLIALRIGTDDLNFSRVVRIEATDSTDRKTWQRIGGERISRVHAGAIRQDRLTIPIGGEFRRRFYRVIISNEDNPPLTINKVTAVENRYETLFFPKAGQPYRILYGGEDGVPPRYDIGDVLAACPAESAVRWTLGAETKNPLFKPARGGPALSGKAILTVAVAAMVLVLVILIARLARKIGPEPPTDPAV